MRAQRTVSALIACAYLCCAAPPALSQGLIGVSTQDQALPSADFILKERERIERLFAALNPEWPGLGGAFAAYERRDIAGACAELLDYYLWRDKTCPVNALNPEPSYETLLRAADAMEGIFKEQNMRAPQKMRPGGGIDWTYEGPKGDKEWAWFVNRHLFLRDMAESWLYTGNDAYAQAISAILADWVEVNPYPDRLTFSAQWRALEVARRILESWTPIFTGMGDALTPEARLMLLASLPDHADSLHEHGSFWGGNHLLTEQSALALLATEWPEFRDSARWLSSARDKLEREILAQSYPDGAYKELTNHYQRVVLDSIGRALLILREAGGTPGALEERVVNMWDYYANVMRPNGTGPLNSAGDLEYNRAGILRASEDLGREDWLYIASDGARGTPPEEPPSRFFPWAGHALMRSGWDSLAQWAFFDIGPHGSAHQHNDRLHLSLSLGQHDILVDSGRYVYQPGRWKEYFTGAQAHNLVMVDGQGPVPPPLTVERPLPVTAVIEESYDFFSASSTFPAKELEGRSGARHRRSVLYVRGRFWLVIDNVQSYGTTQVDTIWHFHPDVGLEADGGDLIAWADVDTALRLRQIGGPQQDWSFVRGGEQPVQGWYSPDYNTKWPAITAVASANIRSPQNTVWLLWPSGTEQPPAFTVRSLGRELIISEGNAESANSVRLDPAKGTLISCDY